MAERESTMERINRLASERNQLYRTAGPMSEGDVQRLQRINQELEVLWVQLRRERAARRSEAQRQAAKDLFSRVA